MKQILLVGGTDPSGAGLQTDWNVVHTMKIQASSVVTAVTAQNKSHVLSHGLLSPKHFKTQLDSLHNTLFSAVKIGMLGDDTIINILADYLKKHAKDTPIILDPVLAASAGGELLTKKGRDTLLSHLLPLTTLITPNKHELGLLTDLSVNNFQEIQIAAEKLLKLGANAVLLKGGHFLENASYSCDVYISQSDQFYLQGQRWSDRQNVRGTGCALATAIAASIAQGYCITDSLVIAKSMISYGIRNAVKEGGGLQLQLKASAPHFQTKDLAKLFCDSPYSNDNHSNYHFPCCETQKLGIYPVVDSIDWIKKLVPLGIKTIQLRIKDKADIQVEAEIKAAIDYCHEYSIRLFINDYWKLAIKYKAYGIHLGQEDVETADLQAIGNSGCRLGLSTHSYTEVARAHAINPSYLALGPIFATTSKDMPWIPQGVDAVKMWVELLGDDYPLVAIGGINQQRAKALLKTGIGSVAMISAITEADDYRKVTQALLNL